MSNIATHFMRQKSDRTRNALVCTSQDTPGMYSISRSSSSSVSLPTPVTTPTSSITTVPISTDDIQHPTSSTTSHIVDTATADASLYMRYEHAYKTLPFARRMPLLNRSQFGRYVVLADEGRLNDDMSSIAPPPIPPQPNSDLFVYQAASWFKAGVYDGPSNEFFMRPPDFDLRPWKDRIRSRTQDIGRVFSKHGTTVRTTCKKCGAEFIYFTVVVALKCGDVFIKVGTFEMRIVDTATNRKCDGHASHDDEKDADAYGDDDHQDHTTEKKIQPHSSKVLVLDVFANFFHTNTELARWRQLYFPDVPIKGVMTAALYSFVADMVGSSSQPTTLMRMVAKSMIREDLSRHNERQRRLEAYYQSLGFTYTNKRNARTYIDEDEPNGPVRMKTFVSHFLQKTAPLLDQISFTKNNPFRYHI